jgi:hypothetical protein
MLHHRLRAAGNFLHTITKISTVTASSSTITVMSNVQAGDLLVLFDYGFNFSGASITNVIPSGFTSIGTVTENNLDNNIRATMSYKIATGTESGTTLTGINSNSETKILILFRGNKIISAVTVGSFVSDTDDKGPVSATITSSSGLTPLIIFADYSYIWAGGTERSFTYTGETPVYDNIYYTIKNKNQSINNVNIGIDYYLSFAVVILCGFYLELE